jgi:integrase
LRNLHDRRYKIGETRQAVETFTQDEVKQMVGAASGQLKLHLLLMLNCGFYQGDISDLRHDEVDLVSGYITRQRSKTRQHHGDKVPVVRYKLWSTTLELLRQHASPHPVLALITRQGKPWVEEKVEGNRVKSRRDGIKILQL